MPKRSRSGDVSRPARVVAPTSVNGGRSSLMERAAGPSPITMSSWKSSIAGYSTSSTTGLRRWISSTNRTSLGSRLVRIAARAPGRSSTGPEGCLRFAPRSLATMCASVGVPRPGGPEIGTWSSAAPRFFAPVMKMVIGGSARGWLARLAEARRAEDQDVVQRLAAVLRRGDEDVHLLLDARLANVVGERPRPDRPVERTILLARRRARQAVVLDTCRFTQWPASTPVG